MSVWRPNARATPRRSRGIDPAALLRRSARPNMQHRRSSSRTLIDSLEARTFLAANGLYGQYYDDANLSVLRMTRQDVAVNFDFGSASPAQPQIGADTFSVRWTGQVQPEFSETYTFHVAANDGVRLWVRGQLLVDRWAPVTQLAGDANRDGTV